MQAGAAGGICKHAYVDSWHGGVIRVQVQLTEAQVDTLKRVAAERGVSTAEVLRELVDAHLTETPDHDRRTRAMNVVGRHHSGRHDVSREHDREIAEAFAR